MVVWDGGILVAYAMHENYIKLPTMQENYTKNLNGKHMPFINIT